MPRRKLTAVEEEAARVRKNLRTAEKRRAKGIPTRDEYLALTAKLVTERKQVTQREAAKIKREEKLPTIGYEFDVQEADKKLIKASDKFLRLLCAEKLSAIREGKVPHDKVE